METREVNKKWYNNLDNKGRQKLLDNTKKYRLTFRGVVNTIYNSQKQASKKRSHDAPDYSFEDLLLYCKNSRKFNILYQNWVDSKYNKKLKPSIDRIDDNVGYTMSNIFVNTWYGNISRASKSVKIGTNKFNSTRIEVVQFDKNGKKVNSFISIAEASRQTGVNASNIQNCIRGYKLDKNRPSGRINIKTAGGYIWEKLDATV